jgi:hypothetical protein
MDGGWGNLNKFYSIFIFAVQKAKKNLFANNKAGQSTYVRSAKEPQEDYTEYETE